MVSVRRVVLYPTSSSSKAIFYYKQAAKYSHNNSQIWSKLAEVYMAEKQFSDALAAFREAILINDQHVTNYIGLAKICLEVEAYTEAENVMTLAFANLKDPPQKYGIWQAQYNTYPKQTTRTTNIPNGKAPFSNPKTSHSKLFTKSIQF